MSMKPTAARLGRNWHNAKDMTITAAGISQLLGTLLATLLLGLPAAWGTLALWYQARGALLKSVIIFVWLAFSIGAIAILWQGRGGVALAYFGAAFAVMLIWWHRISPTNDRLWADDVANITSGSVNGNR